MKTWAMIGVGLFATGAHLVFGQNPAPTRIPAPPAPAAVRGAAPAPAPAPARVAAPAVAAPARVAAPAAPAAAPAAPAAAPAPQEAALRERLAGLVKAYNGRNAQVLADFFTDDARLVDVDGAVITGKAEVGQQFADGFAEGTNYTLKGTIESIRFLTPDVAQVEGTSTLTAANEPSIVTRFINLAVRKDNVWRISEIRDLPAPPEDVPPYERLKELEWMVGDWVSESPDAKISSTVRWGDNKAYLVRNSSAQVGKEKEKTSLLIVAWEPQSGQIKSWSFDSEGGLGVAVWHRASDTQWLLHAEGVHTDGSPTSATQILSLEGKDAVKTSSVDRIIGGVVAPDIDEIVMVRKPPAVQGAAPAAAPAAAVAPAAAPAARPAAPGR